MHKNAIGDPPDPCFFPPPPHKKTQEFYNWVSMSLKMLILDSPLITYRPTEKCILIALNNNHRVIVRVGQV